jgi:hypothetical protein
MLREWRGIAVERESLDLNSLVHDAFIVEKSSFEDRMRVFVELNSLLDEKLQSLPFQERAQILNAIDESNRRPVPWWSGFSADALAQGRLNSATDDAISPDGQG